jgi:hypothetical protein
MAFCHPLRPTPTPKLRCDDTDYSVVREELGVFSELVEVGDLSVGVLFMPELEQIRCQRAQVLMDADSSLDHVFFPDSGVVSVVAVYASASIIEMATIGREGCSGEQAILGAKRSSV